MQTTTPTPSQTEAIIHAARESLNPCPFQPRKNFIESKLSELGLNLRENGVINPLLVRHRKDGKLEIICGECRWRSSADRPHPISGTIMPAIAELPIIIRELTDSQALELMLSENMQRNDLSELEEAEAFAHALKQVDETTGKLAHTQQTLAAKIGVGRELIRDRLSLMKLPKEGREALGKGAISYRVAREVCRAPLALVPKLLDTVLNPRKFPQFRYGADIDDPITAEEVRALTEQMSASLDDAPFPLDDAALVPLKTHPDSSEQIEGGPCIGCFFNSATNSQEAEEPKRGRGRHGEAKRCLNASCYKKKVDVHVASQLTKLKAEGAHLLKESEAEKVLKGGANGSPSPDFVELDRKLDEHERAPGVTDKKAPTWGDVTSDGGGKSIVPILVAVDSKGNVRRFAERKVANVAAEKTGKANMLSLSAGRGRSLQLTDAEKDQRTRRAAEIAAQRQKVAISRHTMKALVAQIVDQGVPADVWPNFLNLAITHAGQAGVLYVTKRREIEGKDIYEAARKFGQKLKGSEQIAFVIELLLAEWFSYACGPNSSGSVVPDTAKPIFKFYGVDLKKAEGEAKAEIASANAAKKPAAPNLDEMAAKSKELQSVLTKAGYWDQKGGAEVVTSEGLKLVRQVARANKLRDWPHVKNIADYDALITAVKARIEADVADLEAAKAAKNRGGEPEVAKILELVNAAGAVGIKVKEIVAKLGGTHAVTTSALEDCVRKGSVVRLDLAHYASETARPWLRWSCLTDAQKEAARLAHETLSDVQLAAREFQFAKGECFDTRKLGDAKEAGKQEALARESNKWVPFEKVNEAQRANVKKKFPKYSDAQLLRKEFWFDGDSLIEARSRTSKPASSAKKAAKKGASK